MQVLTSCLVFLSIWLIRLDGVDAGRILVGAAADVKSHLGSMMPLIKKLARAGHEVTLFHPSSDKAISFGENITPIYVKMEKKDKSNMNKMIWTRTLHAHMIGMVYKMISDDFGEFVTNHSEIWMAFRTTNNWRTWIYPNSNAFTLDQTIVAEMFIRHNNNSLASKIRIITDTLNQEYDLIIVSALFNIHFFAFADILKRHQNVPFIIFASSNFFSSDAYNNAMAQNWVSAPGMFGFEPKDSEDQFCPSKFVTRLTNVGEHLGELVAMAYVDNIMLAHQVAKLTGRKEFSFLNLYKQSSIKFTDAVSYLGLPTALVTEAKVVGAHCGRPSQLPKEFVDFVEDPKSKGTIYVAFGTIVPWDFAPENIKSLFFDALDQLVNYRIIFAFNGQFPERIFPPHMRLVKWAPQLKILQHPKTKVFLTHGGLKSIKESLCTKTPMLVLPMFAEQSHNAKYILKFGIGSVLNKYNLNKDIILAGLNEVLNNPKYSERVDKMCNMFLDRPMSDLDEAEFHVSRVIKMKDKPMFFQRKAMKMYTLQYLYLDLLALAVLAFMVVKR